MKKMVYVFALFSLLFITTACENTNVVCDEGYENRGGVCYEVLPECEEGFELNGKKCVEIKLECQTGYSDVDGTCVKDEVTCELPESNINDVCEVTHVEVVDFVGMTYGEVLTWTFNNNVKLTPTSVYLDDVPKDQISAQVLNPGDFLELGGNLEVTVSRGKNPDAVIELPDFSGMTESEIRIWLQENDISKYFFKDKFDPSIAVGEFVNLDVSKTDEHEGNLRRDTYTFNLSKGPLIIEEVEFNSAGTVRGVNLGGWFVLEGWMTPGLFEGVNGSDETEFMIQKENSLAVIEEHWDTFITEDDFIWLQSKGVEYVRIPIPWWYKGGLAYEGTEYEVTYGNSEFYIRRAMEWAETYNIEVLLDLHTAPWCQNGFDNGGMAGVFEWHKDPANVSLTLDVIENIVVDFSTYDSLWGIEVLNEPAWAVPYSVLLDYYVDAYNTIRVFNNDVYVMFHDGFRGYDENTWKNFFNSNDFRNVIFDIHLYQIFGDFWSDFDIYDHLQWVEIEQDKAIHRYDGIVPTVVGEWSIGLQGNVFDGLSSQSIADLKLAFANAQLNEYEEAFGWFFWNYKIDSTYYTEWDFYRLVEQGIFPGFFGDDEDAN